MTGHEIIEALGGRQAMAALTGAKLNAITQWRTAGIPARFWHQIILAAEGKGVDGITLEVLQATWPADRSRRRGAVAEAQDAA